MMKFDFAILNPPYGTGGNATLHLEFVQEALNRTTGQVVALFPFSFVKNVNVQQNAKKINEYKANFSKTLMSVKEYTNASEYFPGSNQDSIGVYFFDMNKSITDKITIIQPNRIQTPAVLNDYDPYTSYDNFLKYMSAAFDESRFFSNIAAKNRTPSLYEGLNDEDALKKEIETRINSCNKIKDYYNMHDKVYSLVVNNSNGSMDGRILTKNGNTAVGSIIDSYDGILSMCTTLKTNGKVKTAASGYNVIVFDSLTAAENFKAACKRPLLRYGVYKLQTNQHMTVEVYRNIPLNIDWSSVQTHTDAGILQMLGMNHDEAVKAAEYTENIIEQLDNAK